MAHRLKSVGQAQVFSSPLPSAVLGAAISSAKIHLSEDLKIYQKELKNRINYFRKQCLKNQISVSSDPLSPIQFIQIGNSKQTYYVNLKLFERGLFCRHC